MKNFEQFTHELTPEEETIVQILVKRFNEKPGKSNKLTNKVIVSALRHHYNIKTTGPRIRKVVQNIRLKGLLNGLIATSAGYWVTKDPEELKSWIESMEQRENSIRASKKAGERDLQLLNSER